MTTCPYCGSHSYEILDFKRDIGWIRCLCCKAERKRGKWAEHDDNEQLSMFEEANNEGFKR